MTTIELWATKERQFDQVITFGEFKFLTDDAFQEDEREKAAYFESCIIHNTSFPTLRDFADQAHRLDAE